MFNLITLMAGGQEGGNPMNQFIFLVPLILVFYFFMIRPQMRKSKQQKQFREGINKGDKIVTIGGVHGKIIEVEDTTYIVEMLDKTRIRLEKSAISMESTMAVAGVANNTTSKSDAKTKKDKTDNKEEETTPSAS